MPSCIPDQLPGGRSGPRRAPASIHSAQGFHHPGKARVTAAEERSATFFPLFFLFLLFFSQQVTQRAHQGPKEGRKESGTSKQEALPWTLWSWSSRRVAMATVWSLSICRRAASWLAVMSSTCGRTTVTFTGTEGAVIPSLPGERSRKVSGSKLKETSFSCGDSHPHLVWRGRAGIWRGYGSPWREAFCRRVEAPVGMAA